MPALWSLASVSAALRYSTDAIGANLVDGRRAKFLARAEASPPLLGACGDDSAISVGSRLLLTVAKNRGHRGCVHDSEILVAVVEYRIRALDALLLQIAEPFGERLELLFRIQIFEPLGGRNVSFEPVLAVLAMEANIDLVACSFDKRRDNRTIFGRVDRS